MMSDRKQEKSYQGKTSEHPNVRHGNNAPNADKFNLSLSLSLSLSLGHLFRLAQLVSALGQ
jgi:hypothetical protein